MSLNEVENILINHTYLIYTTKSHLKMKKGKVCDRFRLIIPADNIPKDEEVYFVMLRILRHKFKSDEQTENKSAGFLCNEDSDVYLNHGKVFDCLGYSEKAETIVALEAKIKLLEHDKRLEKTNEYQSKGEYILDAEELKTHIDLETMIDIVDTLGFEVNRMHMFSLRDDERTPSAKIYSNGIYDFGSGYAVDIFGLVMDRLRISFPESLEYVNRFIRR